MHTYQWSRVFRSKNARRTRYRGLRRRPGLFTRRRAVTR